MNNPTITLTGNQIAFARVLALRGALKLEIIGLRRSSHGRSTYAIVKDEFGYRGSKQKVLNQLNNFIEDHKEQYFNDNSKV